MTTRPLAVGDLATIDNDARFAGQVFRVTKVNRTTVDLDPTDGGRGVRCPAWAVKRHEGPAPTTPPAIGRTYTPPLAMGTVVTLTTAYKDVTVETPLVVIRENETRVTVAKIGGDGDRYLRVPRSGLRVRTATVAFTD